MKKITFFFMLLLFVQSYAQSMKGIGNRNAIAIADVAKTITCNSEKLEFHIPDILGKNEDNFFNQQIIRGIVGFSGLEEIVSKNPKEALEQLVSQRTKDCAESNGGLTALNFQKGLNNGRIVSISVQLETLAGSLIFDKQFYNFDIQKQQLLTVNHLFSKADQSKVSDKINRELKARLQEYNKEAEHDQRKIVNELLSKPKIFSFDGQTTFFITPTGIEFTAEYEVERGVLPVQENVFMTFSELKNYLNKDFKKML